jgi:integrase
MTEATGRRRRARGGVETLPSGALRVRVYAGTDPVSGRRHYLKEVVPAGPDAERRADAVRVKFLAEVNERRNPRTSATVNQLLDRYLDMHTGGRSTVSGYRGYVDKHVRPFIGQVKVGALDAEMLDSLYAELRRCRDHCTGRKQIHHRCAGSHECDERCRKHECRPLANATIRKIHFMLSGAYKRAVRWRWVSTSPITQAEPPSAPPPDPQPPSAQEAAQLLGEAWLDPDWGALVWLTMTTGARRGELCALRWKHVDLSTGLLTLRRAIAQDGVEVEEKDTKTHQRRHVTLDPETVAVLTEHRKRCVERAAALDIALEQDAFVFSNDPAGRTHLLPSSVTQRYRRMAERLKIETHFHNLRHYSATELIAAGVDIRTVAGRLGHGGGGTTTLRVYAAWVAEADQRAAVGLVSRLPARPSSMPTRMDRVLSDPRTPYERIAADLHAGIVDGSYPVGGPLPTGKELAKTYGVATGTAQRAVTLLGSWGLIEVSRGQRAVVRPATNPAVGVRSHQRRHLADGRGEGGS